MQRIGVFVCHCGSNIAATVDVKKVVEMVSHEPGVVHAEDYQYMCSEVGQAKIIEAIRAGELQIARVDGTTGYSGERWYRVRRNGTEVSAHWFWIVAQFKAWRLRRGA